MSSDEDELPLEVRQINTLKRDIRTLEINIETLQARVNTNQATPADRRKLANHLKKLTWSQNKLRELEERMK
ncbi:hypothetical protein SAMN05444392_10129 [Seinonella peptonophila]|uniref:Uncharacterized protein n=1 Tax=Seinonella peptonophila TaxID=112248 RepID=A0A1M4SLV8_9BACL|nr:hypothetical protein [Seinonella peptonophila]SHE32967.1 hypothetical protein SAMN05444392_10129 [Seinonella peptonophila]